MKNSTIIAIVIIIAALGIWYFVSQKETAVSPTVPTVSETTGAPDTTGAINADLEGIDVGDIDGDIQSLESDIQGL